MERILAESVALQRAQTLLVSLVAGLAAVLAATGLYGLLSYATVRRMRELGVRVALGATPRGIFGSVVRDAMVLTAVGAGAGIALAAVAVRIFREQVFGLAAVHWTAFATAPMLMAVVALVAVWAPARRASTVDPLVVMRES
jgi:ABC-type antimicrobial peptide transport system permease subunit